MKHFHQYLLIVLCILSWNAYTKTLIIGTEDYAPPFEAQTAKGEYFGFDIDIMNAVCEEMKAKCIFKTYDFHKLPDALQNKEIDLAIAGYIITPERRKYLLFSLPYKINYQNFVVLRDSKFETMEQLEGQTIGVYEDAPNTKEIYEQLQNKLQLQSFLNMENMVAALKEKKVSALALDVSRTRYWMSTDPIFKVIGPPFRVGEGYGIAAKLNNQQLINQVNQALTTIEKNGVYLEIYRRYF